MRYYWVCSVCKWNPWWLGTDMGDVKDSDFLWFGTCNHCGAHNVPGLKIVRYSILERVVAWLNNVKLYYPETLSITEAEDTRRWKAEHPGQE